MKNFKKFLEEITIKGNEGIPGENDSNEPKYLKNVEDRADRNLNLRGGKDNPRAAGPLFPRIMSLVGQSQRIISGKEAELEKIAYDVIMSQYGSLFNDDVKLDIKFAKAGRQVKNFMDDCEGGNCKMPETRITKDPELKKEVDKRKLANAVTQGEAKNTKHILNMPEVKEKIIALFGDRTGEEIFSIWNEITSIADKLDWIIPTEHKADMLENAPEGMAGACKVEWKPKDIDKIKPFEVDNKEEEEEEHEEEEESASEFDITVKAIGIDFPMLLHEAVKGIYELITSAGIPGNEELAKKVLMNTDTFADEAEDFRYGPEIAADLRDFVNENRSVDEFPNIREHLFGKMIAMPADEFLKLMKGILMKTDEARSKVDSLISGIVKELKDYEFGEAMPSEQNNDFVDSIAPKEEVESSEESSIDYSTWSQRDLQAERDAALDKEDYETVRNITEFIKDSVSNSIYLRELDRINESKTNR